MKISTAIVSVSAAAHAPAQAGDSPWISEEMLRLVEAVLSSDVIIAGIVVGGFCWAVNYIVPKIVDHVQGGGGISFSGMKIDPAPPIPSILLFEDGDSGKTQNPDQIREDAKKGSAEAQFALAEMHVHGKDDKEAVKWFLRAAEQGHAGAQQSLGVAYHLGRGVQHDYSKAAEWFLKAAKKRHAEAEHNLGVAYANGLGVPKDDEKAAEWLRKAAEQGLPQAQFGLGTMYARGHGVSEDSKKAVGWFRKAAEQGVVQAQIALGLMYARGQGVPENGQEAFIWVSIAAKSGDKQATELRDAFLKKASPDERSAVEEEIVRRYGKIQRK